MTEIEGIVFFMDELEKITEIQKELKDLDINHVIDHLDRLSKNFGEVEECYIDVKYSNNDSFLLTLSNNKAEIKETKENHILENNTLLFDIDKFDLVEESGTNPLTNPAYIEFAKYYAKLAKMVYSKFGTYGDKVDKIIDLCKYIIWKFSGKVDKAGKPYIEHLIAVADKSAGVDDTDVGMGLFVAGILHDLYEDCFLTHQEKEEVMYRTINFPGVNRAVTEYLTKNPNTSYEEYIDKIANSGNMYAVKTKIADLEHNMDIGRLQGKIIDKYMGDRLTKYLKAYKKLITCYNMIF